jgi:hypothetical protein
MALLPLLLVAVLIAVVALAGTAVRGAPASGEETVAAARRHAARTSLAALVLGGVVAAWLAVGDGISGSATPGSIGRHVLLVPIGFGVGHTLTLAIGELCWPRPAGRLRRARLVHRGPLDAAPRWLLGMATAGIALALATVAAGALLADGSGRALTRRSGAWEVSHGPFPGWFYGEPALVGIAALVLALGGALRLVATRAAVVTADDRLEEALRRASAHRVLRGGAASALTLAGGLLVVTGVSVHGVAGPPVPSAALDTLGVLVAGLGFACCLAGVAVLAVRAPDVPADEPVAA